MQRTLAVLSTITTILIVAFFGIVANSQTATAAVSAKPVEADITAMEATDTNMSEAQIKQIEAEKQAIEAKKAEEEAAARAAEEERIQAEEEAAAAAEATAQVQYDENVAYIEDDYAYDGEYSYDGGGYRTPYNEMYNTNGPSRTMPGWYGSEEDGYVETYYSEKVIGRHYLADQWTVDDEGFYHDENGRYIVGVNGSFQDEMPYGTVVMTGKGEGVIYDYDDGSGPSNVHDFYTNW